MVNVSDRILRIFRLRRAEPRAALQSCDYSSFNSKWDMEIIPISHFIFLYHICAADASIFFHAQPPGKSCLSVLQHVVDSSCFLGSRRAYIIDSVRGCDPYTASDLRIKEYLTALDRIKLYKIPLEKFFHPDSV